MAVAGGLLDLHLSGLLPAGLRRRLGLWRPHHDMADCLGKVFIVTGGATGVGFQVTKWLLSHNATVVLATHNMPSARKAVRDVQRDVPHVVEGRHVRLMFLDLTSFRSIDAFVAAFMATGLPLHGLCNCAVACDLMLLGGWKRLAAVPLWGARRSLGGALAVVQLLERGAGQTN